MKLAIVGGRDFDDYNLLRKIVKDYFYLFCEDIISGGAKGADRLAKEYALKEDCEYTEFPAEWDKHGKAAGFIRNQQIVDACDIVLAFWNGNSRGTKDTIHKAKIAKKPTFIIYY